MTQDRRSTPTWQWIAVTALTIVLGMAAWGFQDTRAAITKLEDKKVDKDEVALIRADVHDIKKMMESHIIYTGRGQVARRN